MLSRRVSSRIRYAVHPLTISSVLSCQLDRLGVCESRLFFDLKVVQGILRRFEIRRVHCGGSKDFCVMQQPGVDPALVLAPSTQVHIYKR